MLGSIALGNCEPGLLSTALAHTELNCSAVSIVGRLETFSKPSDTLALTRIWPLCAFLVVIRITPLEPTDAP